MRMARGGFQRWPRPAQAALVQFMLLLGIAFGVVGGMVAFWVAAVTFGLIWMASASRIARRPR